MRWRLLRMPTLCGFAAESPERKLSGVVAMRWSEVGNYFPPARAAT